MIKQLSNRSGKRQLKGVQSFYELITVMAVMGYANYYNKIRFIFAIFDFDGNLAIDVEEIAIMVICFLEGYGKISKTEMAKRKYLEKIAEIIVDYAETVPDGKLSISEIGNWMEANEMFTQLLGTYEPDLEVFEKSSIFLPLHRSEKHLPILSEKYLGKKYMSHDLTAMMSPKKTVVKKKKKPEAPTY